MEDKTKLAILEDLQKLEARKAFFWVKVFNGTVPNLLECINTMHEHYLQLSYLTDSEKKLFNKEYPKEEALNLLIDHGLNNFFVYYVNDPRADYKSLGLERFEHNGIGVIWEEIKDYSIQKVEISHKNTDKSPENLALIPTHELINRAEAWRRIKKHDPESKKTGYNYPHKIM